MSTALRSYIRDEVEALYNANHESFEAATDRIMARLFDPTSVPAKVKGPSTKKKSYDSLNDLAQTHTLILNTIQTHGSLSRQQIANHTGLKVSSVCGRVKELLDYSFLCVDGTTDDSETGKEVETLTIIVTN